MKKKTVKKKRFTPRHLLTIHISVAALGIIMICASLISFGVAYSSGSFNLSEEANFKLFRSVSLAVSFVLLGMTLISCLGSEVISHPSAFSKRIAAVSPVVSAAGIFGMALFFAYLTHGVKGNTDIYIILLGAGESMLFTLPGTLKMCFKIKKEKKKK